MSLALIDADMLCYRSTVAAQEDIDWGDGESGLTVNTKAALFNAKSMLDTWIKNSRCDRALLCFSDPAGDNFRFQIGRYKEDRGEKPEAYWMVVNTLSEEWETKSIPMLEADDVIGILHTSTKIKNTVAVSGDKDLKTIPGKLLDPLKSKRPRLIRPLEADRFWLFQTLTGDPVDGYKGCPKIGKVKAERLLADCTTLSEMWSAVVECYDKAGLTFDDALVQARLARILRREDYDKEQEIVYLWHPNSRHRTTLSVGR